MFKVFKGCNSILSISALTHTLCFTLYFVNNKQITSGGVSWGGPHDPSDGKSPSSPKSPKSPKSGASGQSQFSPLSGGGRSPGSGSGKGIGNIKKGFTSTGRWGAEDEWAEDPNIERHHVSNIQYSLNCIRCGITHL